MASDDVYVNAAVDEGCGGEKADGSGADNNSTTARGNVGSIDAMHNNGKWFDESDR
jgi:hypothetical protein